MVGFARFLCVCVCVLGAAVGVMFGAGPVAARPPWDLPGFPFLPVEVAPGSDVESAPRVWCTSAQTVTFRHSENPTVAYVRLWVPGGVRG